MMRVIVLVGMGLLFQFSAAQAVEDVANTPVSYNGNPPTDSDIPKWTTGWAQPTVQPTGFTSTTGWNYVGSVNGNSAFYLGNGWVLTAAHVGAADLTLGGVLYPMVASSARTFGNADLLVFQVYPAPALPSLLIRSLDPKPGLCQVALLGFGHVNGDRAETWGYNWVTYVNWTIPLTNNGVTYSTTDFLTQTQGSSANAYQVVEGDSGGADFIYNGTSKTWELAGINEAQVSNNGAAPFYSAMVQLDLYQAQILAVTSPPANSPAMPAWALALLAGTLVWMAAPIRTRAYFPDNASSKG